VCPSSNVDTGAVDSLSEHPIDRLRRAGLPVTLNTDDRLMSAVTPSVELARCAALFGWGIGEAYQLMDTALSAAFAEPAVIARIRSRLRPGDPGGGR
jgi:adenosine deaminase